MTDSETWGEALPVIAERSEDGDWDIRAPRIGVVRDPPKAGVRRGGEEAVGSLVVLSRTYTLVLPPGVGGRVTEVRLADRTVPVEYGQVLFRLSSRGDLETTDAPATTASDPATGGDLSLEVDHHAITSPIDGVFYRSPAPGAPPFVETGVVILEGRQLGLIEAMKSFNAVTYGGAGLPPRATVAEIRADDAAEVRQGSVLFVVRAEPE